MQGLWTVLARIHFAAPNFPGAREAAVTITLPKTPQCCGAEPAVGAGNVPSGHEAAGSHALLSETGTPAATQGSARSTNHLGSTTSRGEVTTWCFRVFLWLTNFKPNFKEVTFFRKDLVLLMRTRQKGPRHLLFSPAFCNDLNRKGAFGQGGSTLPLCKIKIQWTHNMATHTESL